MPKRKQYSFVVTVRQRENSNVNFGTKPDWAKTIKQILCNRLETAEVVSVNPRRVSSAENDAEDLV